MNLLLFSLLASLWGGSFVAIKSALESFPPFFSASLRVGTAFLAILIMFRLLKVKTELETKAKLLCYTLGFFSITLPFSLLFWGEQFVNAGLAGVINGTVPIWTFLTAYYIFQTEKTSVLTNLIGIGISFSGVAVIFSNQLSIAARPEEIAGIIAIFGMAISYAIGANLAKYAMTKYKSLTPKKAIFHQHYSAGICLIALSLGLEFDKISLLNEIPMKASLAIVYLGVFSTGIAYLILFHLLGAWGPVRAMGVTYLVPVMALLFDYIFHGNYLNPTQFTGVLIIALGLLVLQKPKKLLSLFRRSKIRAENLG
jgi:drug/metabolite transporter (DMT)-like permease